MKKSANIIAIGSVVDLIMGQAPSSKDTNFEGKGTPFVKVGEFGAIRPVIREWTTSPLRMAKRTDVLLCVVGATCGKINMGEECAIGRSVAALRPHPSKIDQFYLYYFMMTIVESLRSGSVGAAQTVISKEMVETVLIPVPPLPEQQRIVGILDEAFDGIATAKANAEKNLQNARALFESHLQSVFTQRGEGWVEKKMGDVCEVKDGTHDSPKYVIEGIPFVTQKNIRIDGLCFANTKCISKEDHDKFYRRSNVSHGDILISMIGANRGMACIVDDNRVFSIKNVGLVKRNDNVNQHFLMYFLKSPQAASYIRSGSKGGAQEFIGLTELRNFPVHLPSLGSQNMIASKFKALSAETQRLESIYQQKLASLDELKKSLLHKAFSGGL